MSKNSIEEEMKIFEALNDKNKELREKYFKKLNISTEAKNLFKKLKDYKGHSLRITELTSKIGNEMNLSNKKIYLLNKSGLFHDIGKIKFKDWIFENEEDLTHEEIEEYLKPHAEDTKKILKDFDEFSDEEINLAYHHHEELDGEGYPDELKVDEITKEMRILKCCDTFEAITADRPHSPAQTFEETKDIMLNKINKKIDTKIAKLTLKVGKEMLANDLIIVSSLNLDGKNTDDIIKIHDNNLDTIINLKKLSEQVGIKEKQIKKLKEIDREEAKELREKIKEEIKENKKVIKYEKEKLREKIKTKDKNKYINKSNDFIR